ncbi:[4Fe-4S] proteins maturation [Mortierella alpina]|uniref:[4Fe-4S] proteins maturation n=1 Tax=Mortierella alpina TaxID=64518 RepID=A0A9P6M6N3_MORAP|nr:[4Fe-4S] proteins maturation [Mortierella alpina]
MACPNCIARLPRAVLQRSRPAATFSTAFRIRSCAVPTASASPCLQRTLTTLSRPRSLLSSHSPIPASSPQSILARSSVVFRHLRFNSSAAAAETVASSGTDANASSSLKIHNPQFDEAGKELTVDITDKAVKQLKHIATRDKNPLQALRITVDSGGCHGYQYLLDLTDEVNEDDVVFDKDGARVIIDTITLPMVSGSRIDFIEELIGSAFKVLANPHAAHSCGCDTSFEIKI